MGLEEDLESIEKGDSPEVVCQKYDSLRNKKMEVIYNGKQDKLLFTYLLLYNLIIRG